MICPGTNPPFLDPSLILSCRCPARIALRVGSPVEMFFGAASRSFWRAADAETVGRRSGRISCCMKSLNMYTDAKRKARLYQIDWPLSVMMSFKHVKEAFKILNSRHHMLT